jgi:hypothetical protein
MALPALQPAALAQEEEKEKDDYVVPLFEANESFDVTITAPFSVIVSKRSLTEEEPGQLTYDDPVAGETTLDIQVRTRGRYRAQKEVCNFPPLRLNFRKTKGTLFAKSDKMKLVTHCRDRIERYTQALLREYVAYRILNIVTDRSFRVRLMRITYIDSGSGETIDTNYGFLIEHRDQLVKRLGMKVDESESTTVEALDGAYTNLVSVYQYLIGNTDFSPIKGARDEPCCHNHVLIGNEEGTLLSVPYDFDMSGLVSAPHASPNPRFRLRNVRERLYRGRCANNEHLDKSLDLYRDSKQAIYDLIDSVPGLSKTSSGRAKKFIEDFYDIAESPKRTDRELRNECI